MYSWATKEYLLWEMSLGQIIMYFNLGIEWVYPGTKENENGSKFSSAESVKKKRKELEALGLIEPKHTTEALKGKYGDIDG